MLSILAQFQSNRSQHVLENSCWSNLVNVVPEVPRGCVLDLLLFLQYTSEPYPILDNKLMVSADNSTLMAVEPSPSVRVTVAELLIGNLDRVSEWCDLCLKKLNASKTRLL